MKTIKLGFLGLGNIGGGVVRVIKMNGDHIEKQNGVRFELVRALVLDVNCVRTDLDMPDSFWTEDVSQIVEADDIDMIVEAMGGEEPAASFIERALKAGKTVVSANKAAIAPAWKRLDRAARESGAGLYIEATAGGAMPIVDVINNSLNPNHIKSIMGIVNGTTNYMLWRMHTLGMDYAAALKEAQELGYAEPDPTYDVTGKDAAFKLSILASLAMKRHVKVEDIVNVGITQVSADDIAMGKALGMTLKLLAVAKDNGDTVEAHVYPTFLYDTHQMAGVSEAFNAVYYIGDMVDDGMLFGKGAGQLPTASALVSDCVRAAKAPQHTYQTFFEHGVAPAVINNDSPSAFVIRFIGKAEPIVASLQAAGLEVIKSASLKGRCAVLVAPAMEADVKAAADKAGTVCSIYRAEI